MTNINVAAVSAAHDPVTPPPKPVVIFAAPPAHGHTAHLLPHVAHLVSQGYPVFFAAGAQFEHAITRTGATFRPTPSTWTPEALSRAAAPPPGHHPFIWEQERLFLDAAPACARVLRALLEDVRDRFPAREVVVVEEMLFMGSWPLRLGAPLPRGYERLAAIVTFSSYPVWVSSHDTAPFGDGLPPDSSAAGRARNRALYEALELEHGRLMERASAVYAGLGATVEIGAARAESGIARSTFDVWAGAGSKGLTVYPCSPGLEYLRTDLPQGTRFIGGAPRPAIDPSSAEMPSWWGELVANEGRGRKKVVFVTQGTVASDLDNLVKPTLAGLGARDDVLVVAVLGRRGADLGGFEVPANARVGDYLPYHAVLRHADVFVSNGGYGGFMQAVMYGVPMVLAGTTQDKAEVSMRGEWAGIAVNLRTDTPRAEDIPAAVDRILGNEGLRARAREMQRENEEMDCLGRLERVIEEVVEREKEWEGRGEGISLESVLE